MFSSIRNKSIYLRRFHTSTICSMPKKRNKQTNQVVVESGSSQIVQSGPVISGKAGVEIKILAKPGAKCNSVTDISETVGIQIAAPPVDGEANSELVKYLSKVLGLKKSQVTLDKGSKSRNKTVVISGANTEEILQKLQKEMDSS